MQNTNENTNQSAEEVNQQVNETSNEGTNNSENGLTAKAEGESDEQKSPEATVTAKPKGKAKATTPSPEATVTEDEIRNSDNYKSFMGGLNSGTSEHKRFAYNQVGQTLHNLRSSSTEVDPNEVKYWEVIAADVHKLL